MALPPSLPSREPLMIYRDILDATSEKLFTDMWWKETRNADLLPTLHGKHSPRKHHMSPNGGDRIFLVSLPSFWCSGSELWVFLELRGGDAGQFWAWPVMDKSHSRKAKHRKDFLWPLESTVQSEACHTAFGRFDDTSVCLWPSSPPPLLLVWVFHILKLGIVTHASDLTTDYTTSTAKQDSFLKENKNLHSTNSLSLPLNQDLVIRD